MSKSATPLRSPLRELAAEEIRVILARRRMSAAELARRTGIKQSTMARRMTGETALDLDDLERIAAALAVNIADLLPTEARKPTREYHRESRIVATIGEPRDRPHRPVTRTRPRTSSRPFTPTPVAIPV